MFSEITRCRVCGNRELASVLDLGSQALTGVFPSSAQQAVGRGPLELVKCSGDPHSACGLVQLKHSFDGRELYGEHYGYRSGLNRSIVEHLRTIARDIVEYFPLPPGSVCLDIGSNDGTLLGSYPDRGLTLVGVDPTIRKFRRFYKPEIQTSEEFFSLEAARSVMGRRKAAVVTSIAMFYDVEAPLEFMRQVGEVLDDDGIWIFEQSYLPFLLSNTAYDSVCHEHLSYFALKQIKWMMDRAGLKIIGLATNTMNGGSLRVAAAKEGAMYPEDGETTRVFLDAEAATGLDGLAPFNIFREKVLQHRQVLREHLAEIRRRGETIAGYGASTKGNVLLQFCGLTPQDIAFIADVNPDKFGCVTPGTHIPIISEDEARSRRPDHFLVLPWHLREDFLQRESSYLEQGGRFLFPLPHMETVGRGAAVEAL